LAGTKSGSPGQTGLNTSQYVSKEPFTAICAIATVHLSRLHLWLEPPQDFYWKFKLMEVPGPEPVTFTDKVICTVELMMVIEGCDGQ
jgi:hypothetical protein